MSKKAWTNLMTIAVNTGLERNIFTLDENTFKGGNMLYDVVYQGIPLHINARDNGYSEIAFNIYVNYECSNYCLIFTDKLHNYDFQVNGWLERKTGKYLMKYNKSNIIGAPHNIRDTIASWTIQPNGFELSGPLII